MPTYRQSLNNDIIWCFGNAAAAYHCSTAALVGVTNPAEGGRQLEPRRAPAR